jgi:hypothetical protein
LTLRCSKVWRISPEKTNGLLNHRATVGVGDFSSYHAAANECEVYVLDILAVTNYNAA